MAEAGSARQVTNPEVIWRPNPKQEWALMCPAFELFFGGARFGGKSDFLLADFLDGVNHGGKHRGILFRKTYSELEEILIRSRDIYGAIGGQYAETKRTWTFPGGSTLKLRFIERDTDVHHYQGHQYCVAEGTLIEMADGSAKPIEYVSIGDMVHTLEGPKRVIDKVIPYKTQCVKVDTPLGSQVHPATHPILTADGWQSYASLGGICSKEFEDLPAGYEQLRPVSVIARLLKPRPYQALQLPQKSIQSHTACISSVQLLGTVEGQIPFSLDHGLQHRPLPRDQGCTPLPSLLAHNVDVLSEWRTVQGSQGSYQSCSHSYGAQPLVQKEIDQGCTPLPVCVEESSLSRYTLDARGSTPLSIRNDFEMYEYVHPYTGKARLTSEETFYAPCLITPCGERVVHDLTVEDANHYISYDTHIVNKNTWIAFDELTNWATDYCYKYMFSCARSPDGLPVRVRSSGNPGSVGHAWVKGRFIDGIKPYHLFRDPFTNLTRTFIPSRLEDNDYARNDPDYELRLKNLPPHLYRAHRFGDWDIFIGQAFGFMHEHHVIDPIPIPDGAQVYMTMDWGYGAPFSIGWWWVDNDGRIYRFNEWYGWNGNVNEGLRLTDPQIASGIIERERKMGLNPVNVIRLAGPDCFSRKPDYKGGGQGPSTSEEFSKYGLYLSKGDPTREHKIRQFRERLRIIPDTRPMLQVYNNCTQFIRTIPMIQTDPKNAEYIIDTGECHTFDEACHICMARPIALRERPTLRNIASIRIDEMEKVSHDDIDVFISQFAHENNIWDNILTGNDEHSIAYATHTQDLS